ncbi:acetylxylan esterase, partial [bacterium]|nr:acetylxylan esterase [bacterium]
GYMTKPHGAAPHSIGAIAYTHGAAVPAISSRIPSSKLGMIAFDFNAHGHEDGMKPEYYKNLSDTKLKQYWLQGWESRDTCYFLGMFKRLMRAIDFLTRQPEWDGKVLVVYGGSQGGAQAIAAAGLDSRVSCIVAGIPAMCDLSGWAARRIDGWPHAIKIDRNWMPVNPRIAATVPYYDNDYFARRVKCDALFTTGLVDLTCHPCSVMAAYNSLGSERKELLTFPKYAHVFGGDAPSQSKSEQFVRESAARVRGETKLNEQ